MRTPKFISPSQLNTWDKDPEEYYLKYLSDTPPPRMKQTQPMSVGSSFDAYTKAAIHKRIIDDGDPQFEFSTIFDKQVEEHNRDWALKAGAFAFKCYIESGAFGELIKHLESLEIAPSMEQTDAGTPDGPICGDPDGPGPVVLLGIPDLWWVTDSGTNVIFDWKVNGFCSASGMAPAPGYVKCSDGWGDKVYPNVPHSRGHGGPHRDVSLIYEDGMTLSMEPMLQKQKPDWAIQTSVYSWLAGARVGSEIVVAIDQLACKPRLPHQPLIRVAQHRSNITENFQMKTYARFQELWDIVHSDHIFRKMTKEQSQERCATLDDLCKGLEGDTPQDEWFRSILGRH